MASRLQVAIRLLRIAAVLPPLSLPRNVQFLPTYRDSTQTPFGTVVVDF